MGQFEAVADAVTGGLLGRVVEPRAGEGTASGHTHEKNCLNCVTPLVGSYCYTCGQHAHIHRTLRAFAQDLLTGTLNFEGKTFKTLPLLAWRPGDLTRRYINGQRARFVSPLALFLFSVFLLFAVLQLVSGPQINNISAGNHTYHSTDEAIAGAKAKIASLEAKRMKANPQARAPIEQSLAEQHRALNTLLRFKDEGVSNAILADKDDDIATSELP